MANVAIVNNETIEIAGWYEAASPNQSSFGGDWANDDLFTHVLLESGSTDIVFASLVEGQIVLSIDTDKQAAKQFEAVKQAVKAAKEFGSNLADEFSAENVVLGIDTATSALLIQRLAGLFQALQAGSLFVGVEFLKHFDPLLMDETFLTEARLLKYLNKMEDYLGITKTTALV